MGLRKPRLDLPDAATAQEGATPPWIDYSARLVTPLFGGDVVAGEVDSAMPIRAASIRGQLRYWWRIAFGRSFRDSREMFQRELAVWGGAWEAISRKPAGLTYGSCARRPTIART